MVWTSPPAAGDGEVDTRFMIDVPFLFRDINIFRRSEYGVAKLALAMSQTHGLNGLDIIPLQEVVALRGRHYKRLFRPRTERATTRIPQHEEPNGHAAQQKNMRS
jgi:hypothetical protein